MLAVDRFAFTIPALTSIPYHTKPRYLRVRYEDIASSAELTVEHVYRWSGLGTVPSRVSLWINENTRLPDCGDSHAATAATATTIAAPEDGRESHRAATEEIANASAGSARDTIRTTAVAGGGGDSAAVESGRAVEGAAQGARGIRRQKKRRRIYPSRNNEVQCANSPATQLAKPEHRTTKSVEIVT